MQRIDYLERELNALRSLVKAQRNGFEASAPAVTISERKRYDFAAQLAQPRKVVRLEARNATTGNTITSAKYSARQLERFAMRFARLTQPTRAAWRGDREAFGLMRDLFAEHGTIVRNVGRVWTWAVWPAERREIAARIAAALSQK